MIPSTPAVALDDATDTEGSGTAIRVRAYVNECLWLALGGDAPIAVVVLQHPASEHMARGALSELGAALAAEGCSVLEPVAADLAPEQELPTNVLVAAYRWALAQGVQPDDVAIVADEDAADHVVAVVDCLRRYGDPLPAGALVVRSASSSGDASIRSLLPMSLAAGHRLRRGVERFVGEPKVKATTA